MAEGEPLVIPAHVGGLLAFDGPVSLVTHDGQEGTHFAVWAPNAGGVWAMGDFNGWSRDSHPLRPTGSSGVWEGFVPGITQGTVYKYVVRSRSGAYLVDKADPYAIHAEVPPKTGSVVWVLVYQWSDAAWMAARATRNTLAAPMSIYEVHLGSWMRKGDDGSGR